MNTQASRIRIEVLEAGRARSLGRLGGEMTVLSGRIWLTRDGVLDDQFFDAGETVRIAVADCAVIESASRNDPATLRWTPRRQTVAGRMFAGPLLGLALVARAIAGSAAALAGSVSLAASRAEGCIDPPMQGGR